MNEDDANLMTPGKAFVPMCQGGEGSGNFGHEGRPGEVGGSGAGGGSTGLHFDKNGLLTAGHDESHYSSQAKEILDGKSMYQWKEETLLPQEYQSLENYTASGYKQINPALRNGTIKENPKLNKDTKTIVRAINEKAPTLPRGTELYRGIGEETANEILSKDIGETFGDKAFQSFTLNPSMSPKFSKSGVIIHAIAQGTEKALPGHIGEHEFIFAPGTNWKIIGKESISKLDGSKMHIITVRKQ